MSRQRWGQNFLVNPGVVQRIAESAAPGPEDLVIEVGPGHGILTRALLESGCRVVALEIDPELVAELRESFADEERVEFRHLDAIQAPWLELGGTTSDGNALFVANLPYESATAILIPWLEASLARPALTRAVLMVQLEVGERLAAAPRSKAYGSLGALAQATHEVSKVLDVSPGSFRPAPKVRSRVVRLERRDAPLLDLKCWKAGAEFLHAAFAKRRKQLASALAGHGELTRERWQDLLGELGQPPTARAEELTPEELLALGRAAGMV